MTNSIKAPLLQKIRHAIHTSNVERRSRFETRRSILRKLLARVKQSAEPNETQVHQVFPADSTSGK
jgi:hypothetical protein